MASVEDATLKGLTRRRSALSYAHLKEFGPLNSAESNFLKAFANETVYRRLDEFDGDDVISDFWTFGADATAVNWVYPTTQIRGGVLVGVTGTADNDGLGMIGQCVVDGDHRGYFHTHFQVSAVTSLQFEMGLVDAVTDLTLPVISDVDTPANASNGAADLVVVHMDTDQTLKTMALVYDGSTSGMNCAKTNIGILKPTADVNMCVRIGLDINGGFVIINNARQYYKTFSSNVEGGTALAPWLYFRSRSAAARTAKIDMVELMCERG